MKLTDDAHVWHRLWSMRLTILTTIYTAAAGAWVLLPPDWQPQLSEGMKALLAGIGVALPALAAVARVVRQDLPARPAPAVTVPPPAKTDA